MRGLRSPRVYAWGVVTKPEKKDLSISLHQGDRLVFAILGILVMFYGYGQSLRGKAIYTDWRGMDVTAQFVILLLVPWVTLHRPKFPRQIGTISL